MYISKKNIFIHLLLIGFIAAPMQAAMAEIRDITPAMVNKACCQVAAGYNKSNGIRRFTLGGGTIAALGALGYYMLSKKGDDLKAAQVGNLAVAPTLEGIAKSVQKMEELMDKKSDSEGLGGIAKGIAKTFAAVAVVGFAFDKLKDWIMAPERYRSIASFKDANTSFNGHKDTIEKALQFASNDPATNDNIEYWSHLYAQLNAATLKLCGYMQFRIAAYNAAGARSEDLTPFAGVIKNIMAITAKTNAELRTIFAGTSATMEQIVEIVAKFAVQVDIECGAFEVYERSYNHGGF